MSMDLSSITDTTFTDLDYVSNTAGVLYKFSTAYHLRAPGWCPCCWFLFFIKFASVLCFFVLFVALYIVHNVVSVSGLSIHDCPFGFL